MWSSEVRVALIDNNKVISVVNWYAYVKTPAVFDAINFLTSVFADSFITVQSLDHGWCFTDLLTSKVQTSPRNMFRYPDKRAQPHLVQRTERERILISWKDLLYLSGGRLSTKQKVVARSLAAPVFSLVFGTRAPVPNWNLTQLESDSLLQFSAAPQPEPGSQEEDGLKTSL